MPKTFILELPTEGSTAITTTISAAATTFERPEQCEVADIEMGPITVTPIPKPSTSLTLHADIMSAIAFQAMA